MGWRTGFSDQKANDLDKIFRLTLDRGGQNTFRQNARSGERTVPGGRAAAAGITAGSSSFGYTTMATGATTMTQGSWGSSGKILPGNQTLHRWNQDPLRLSHYKWSCHHSGGRASTESLVNGTYKMTCKGASEVLLKSIQAGELEAKCLLSSDRGERRLAAELIAALGKFAVSTIMVPVTKSLEPPDNKIREMLLKTLQKAHPATAAQAKHLMEKLPYLEGEVAREAERAFLHALKAPDAFDFAAATQSYRDKKTNNSTLNAKTTNNTTGASFGLIGSPYLTGQLIAKLDIDRDTEDKRDALASLPMVNLAESPVPPWDVADKVVNLVVNDPAPQVRKEAACTLRRMSNAAAGHLVRQLRHTSTEVRRHSATNLARLQGASVPFVNVLVTALEEEEDSEVRILCAKALCNIVMVNPHAMTRQHYVIFTNRQKVTEGEERLYCGRILSLMKNDDMLRDASYLEPHKKQQAAALKHSPAGAFLSNFGAMPKLLKLVKPTMI